MPRRRDVAGDVRVRGTVSDDTALDELHGLIDWRPLEAALEGHPGGRARGGRMAAAGAVQGAANRCLCTILYDVKLSPRRWRTRHPFGASAGFSRWEPTPGGRTAFVRFRRNARLAGPRTSAIRARGRAAPRPVNSQTKCDTGYVRSVGKRYSHLSLEERCPPARHDRDGSGHQRDREAHGSSPNAVIQRELKRNRCADGYRPDSAGRRAWARKLRGSKISDRAPLRDHVEDRLAMDGPGADRRGGWSWRDRSAQSARSPIYRHAYSPAGRRALRGCWRSANREARAPPPQRPAPAPYPTARRSISGRQRRIFAASSAIGRAI